MCSGGSSTKKGKYNKKQNLEKPIDYIRSWPIKIN